jgi:hypothetical protein
MLVKPEMDMPIKPLIKTRFDALCYSRTPFAHAVSKEVEWFAELYLFAFFYEQRFAMPRDYNRPDFLLTKDAFPIAVEAVTANPSDGEQVPSPSTNEELKLLQQEYMPIKFGSALFTKLQKRYWELPHVQGIPFLLAIHDFIGGDSMVWSASALEEYLYGTRATWWHDEKGKLHIQENSITEHRWGNKVIPSGFFGLPGAENVSAVIFSNAATISKFSRIGKLAEFGDSNVLMVRRGRRPNPDQNSTEAIEFEVVVEPGKYSELWSEGVRVFHNPRAKIPIPKELFFYCSHHFFHNGRRVALLPENFVFESKTVILTPKENELNNFNKAG